jgi:AcrR family transcriptional regulator
MADPRWRRRKDARPGEIAAAAREVFADHGFAAAKLDEIARLAGVAKGSIYLYFPTKEELFRAVVRLAVVPDMETVRGTARAFDGPIAELAPRLLQTAATLMAGPSVARFARMVIGEARNFPDLARIWHDEVVSPVLTTLAEVIARAQACGEVRPGDPRLYAFSLAGPLLMATLFRDVFGEVSPDPPDLARLAEQHADMVLHGFLTTTPA